MHTVEQHHEQIALNWDAILLLLGALFISAGVWGTVIATLYVLLR